MANIKINSTPTRVQAVAGAADTIFTYGFPIKADADLKVYKRASTAAASDSDDLLTLTTDYTVTGAGVATGGTIVLVVGADANDIITIVGAKEIDRNAIYEQLVTLTRSDLNNDFNDNVMYDKQTATLLDEIVPRYNDNERVSPSYRPEKLKLPMLGENEFWAGRGSAGGATDDIVTLSVDSSLAPTYLAGNFVVTEDESLLPNSTNIGALATGLILNTVTAGSAALTKAVEGTDYYEPGGTDVAVVDGGTGASTAAAARTNLGLDTMATQAASAVAITGGTAVLTSLQLGAGATPTQFDTDDTLAADSDTRVPTQQAVKAYVDNNASAGVAKAWVVYDQSGPSVDESLNVTSVTDTSPGTFTVNWAITMSSSNYLALSNCNDSSTKQTNIDVKTTTTSRGLSRDLISDTLLDSVSSVAIFGDLS